MLELVIGYVDHHGKADPVIDGITGTQKVVGKRNAVCKTKDGRSFHIRDWTWCKVQSYGLKVPQFKDRRGRFIGIFPNKQEPVYALVDFSIKGEFGKNPDAQAWCAGPRYEEGLKRVIGQHHVWEQDELLDAIRDIIHTATPDRTPEVYSAALEAIDEIVWRGAREVLRAALPRHSLVINFTQHYLYGKPAEEINFSAPS